MTQELFMETGVPGAPRRLHEGPLGCFIDGFAASLLLQGYRKTTTSHKVSRVANLNRWFHRRGLSTQDLDEQQLIEFLKCTRQSAAARQASAATLHQFLVYLREQRAVPPAPVQVDDSEWGCLERDFKQYLVEERSLSRHTRDNYLLWVRRFHSQVLGTQPIQFEKLDSRIIGQFILQSAGTVSPGSVKVTVTALRCFFRFLRMRGDITKDLAAAVPTVPHYRLSTIPKSLSPAQIDDLLRSCDQGAVTGQRDYTILLLLARLGLRACEIVGMCLDDIDWEVGELTIRGKDSREDRLPIPYDVGEALAKYLRDGRPRCATRRVFVRRRAPIEGFAGHTTIRVIVCRALARAGLDPPVKGPHLLRHSLATQMLRNGVSLDDIGEVLRHLDRNTTQIYAKVDIEALRQLAQPWPS